jgi:hypothetical protein
VEIKARVKKAHPVGTLSKALGSITAPILDSKQRGIAAISIAGPVSRITRGKVPPLAKSVQAAADAISAKIRGPLSPEGAKAPATPQAPDWPEDGIRSDGSKPQFLRRGPPSRASHPHREGT